MIGNREMSFDDYANILRRRLRLIVLPAIAGAIVGFAITLFIPAQYTSTSLILDERPTIPEDLIQSSHPDDLLVRLATMQERIESRTRLQPLIERYDLFKSERKKSMEDAVEAMRKVIEIKPVMLGGNMLKTSGKELPLPGFSIGYTADTAHLAQQVTSELTSMFITEDLQQNENMAKGTAQFLSNSLADAKRALDEQDQKMEDFKRKNLGSLPGDQQANLQVLATLSTQLAAVTDQISRAQLDKTYEQSLLTQQEATWHAVQNGDQPAAQVPTLQEQLNKMKDSLALLQGRYTDDYPDVVKLKGDIAQLQQQIDAQKAAGPKSGDKKPATQGPAPGTAYEPAGGQAASAKTAPGQETEEAGNPALVPTSIQELRARLKQDDNLIQQRTKEQARLQEQVKAYEGRVGVSPLVEEAYKQLNLGHDAALKFYDTLLASQNQSQMTANAQSNGQGEEFHLLDSPSLPLAPSFPVWWQFLLGGLGAGLAIGVVVAFILELRDKALRDERDVEFYLEIPTLAVVPAIELRPIGNGAGGSSKRGPKQSRLQPAGIAGGN
ncbi:MAG TPA: Wzz/FepE/Etk N-terminal domain-containing protein [Terriglobia bacterium]|nr:Wzz/FepE/Etk N-terminal domain-containing protein [Terriglobia bacterium]